MYMSRSSITVTSRVSCRLKSPSLGCLFNSLFRMATGFCQSSALLALYEGKIHRWPVDSPHKGSTMPTPLSCCHDVIMILYVGVPSGKACSRWSLGRFHHSPGMTCRPCYHCRSTRGRWGRWCDRPADETPSWCAGPPIVASAASLSLRLRCPLVV